MIERESRAGNLLLIMSLVCERIILYSIAVTNEYIYSAEKTKKRSKGWG